MKTEGETWRKSEGEENGKKKNGAGEAFALRPGMKIVLLVALREGKEPSIISALARATKGRGQALSLSLFSSLDSHQCVSSIIASLTAWSIPASGSLEDFDDLPGRRKHRWERLLADIILKLYPFLSDNSRVDIMIYMNINGIMIVQCHRTCARSSLLHASSIFLSSNYTSWI